MKRPLWSQSARNQKVVNYHQELNSFLDNAKWFKENRLDTPIRTTDTNTHEGEYINVSTDGIYSFEQFDVVVITGLYIDTDTFPESIITDMVLEVARYNEAEHKGLAIAILQEPLEKGGSVAIAKISGSSLVNVNVISENHSFYKLSPDSAVMESASSGILQRVASEKGTGVLIGFGNIIPEPTEQQFKVVEIIQDDVVKCVTYIDGVDGSQPINVALPWDLRRTPFDRVPVEDQLDPLLRYEYFSQIERRAFLLDEEEHAEALQAVETADAQKAGADKLLENAEIDLAEAILGGIPAEIAAAEAAVASAEAAVASAEAAQVAAAQLFGGLEEREEDQAIVKRYLAGSIINASRNIVGFGDVDIPDIDGVAVVWMDNNKAARFWMDNPNFEEPAE